MRDRIAVTVYIAPSLWEQANTYAGKAGHDIQRDVVAPALLEYAKVQADARGDKMGRCGACNATTIDGQCLDCGWTGCV